MMMIIALLLKLIYLGRDPYETKYQYIFKKHEKNGLENLKDLKVFFEYSNNIQDVYENFEDFNPRRKCNALIVFNDMIADILSNKKLSLIVTEIFIRGRKLNISSVFIAQSYIQVPKDVRLNCTHFFIMKITTQ